VGIGISREEYEEEWAEADAIIDAAWALLDTISAHPPRDDNEESKRSELFGALMAAGRLDASVVSD
jgi:hypothetical protein